MKKVVITGAFDGLHEGHRAILEFARNLGDHLTVLIDSDGRVKRFKGNGRPLTSAHHRGSILRDLLCVDQVLIFSTEWELINILNSKEFEVRVVGSDWKNKRIVGAEYSKEIVYFDRIPGISTTEIISKMGNVKEVTKGWGKEIVFHNSPEYCGKLLIFNKGGKSSAHFHILKQETWYLNDGLIELTIIDPVTAEQRISQMKKGDIVTMKRGQVHQVHALEDSVIFEVSTQDFPTDSYRVLPGDSQTK